jgi:Domain of unknown function (DUF4192)
MNLRPGPHITSPSDLLALVPTALGFHPEHSLVLVVTAGDVGQMHARVDLPHDDEEDETAEVLDIVLAAVRKAKAHQVVVIAYCDDEHLAEDLVDVLLERLEALDVDVLWAVRADGERWYSLDLISACAPDDGVPYDVSSHPITAQAVLDGRVTFDSRSDLADSLVGTDLDAIEAVQEGVDEAVRGLAADSRHPLGMESPEGLRAHLMTEGYWVRQRVRRYVQTGEPLDNAEAGRLVAATVNIDVRDVAWAEMTRADARAHVELWRDIVRRTPPDLLAAPAALLAFAAWLAGEGALAWCAVERCHEVDPDYSMATLVSQALVAALHPSAWQPVPAGDLPLFAG